MLYATSVRVSLGKQQRRIDIIVEAKDAEQATEKALKKARSIYAPGKKAVYTIIGMVNENEAQDLAVRASEVSPASDIDSEE